MKIEKILVAALLAILEFSILIVAGPLVHAQDPAFGNTLNLSSNTGASYLPQVAASGTYVYVVWQDDTPGNDDVFFRRSADNGVTFDPIVNLSNNPGNSTGPLIAVSGNYVYVIWADNTPGNFDVFFTRSTDNGATFGPIVNLSSNPGNSYYRHIAQVTGSANYVYAVWADNTPGNYEVFFTRSTDNGVTFDPVLNLSNTAGFSTPTRIAVSGNYVYVGWEDNTLGNFDVFLSGSADNGASFQSAVNLSNNPGDSYGPLIGVSGNYVYVGWIDNTPGNFEIFFRRSSDNGTNFGPVVNLSNDFYDSGLFGWMMTSSGSNVYIVWADGKPRSEILYTRSTDNGATFSKKSNLSQTPGSSERPQIATSGSGVYVVWAEYTQGNGEVFFRASSDNGVTFGSTLNLSSNPGASYLYFQNIAASGSHVYVAWYDNTPGNFDILFRAS